VFEKSLDFFASITWLVVLSHWKAVLLACGLSMDIIRFQVQCICTTGGAVEEDIMKTKNPHYVGSFKLKGCHHTKKLAAFEHSFDSFVCFVGKEMRLKGQNRLGNLIVPNKNYCDFEDFMNPILDDMLKEQKEKVVGGSFRLDDCCVAECRPVQSCRELCGPLPL